jgi:hypothetical protein
MRRIVTALAAVALFAGLGAAGAGAAAASPRTVPDTVNPVTVFTGLNTQSMAGYAANEFGLTATQVDGTFTLNGEAAGAAVSFIKGEPCVVGDSVTVTVAEDGGVAAGIYWCVSTGVDGPTTSTTFPSGGGTVGTLATANTTVIGSAIGLELCDESNGDAAQLGAVNLGDIGTGGADEWAAGYLTGTLTGGVTSPVTNACWGSGVIGDASTSTTFTPLGLLADGSTVTGQIKQEYSHSHATGDLFTIEANADLTNYSYFDACHTVSLTEDVTKSYGPDCSAYYNEADAGVQSDLTGLSAPAVNDLTDFTGVTAVFDGVQSGLAAWNDDTIEASADGVAPALLAPTALSPAVAQTCVYHPAVYKYDWVGHYGHREYYDHGTKFRWVKGDRHEIRVKLRNAYTTCTGGGASSFSVDAGTPVS